jgi:nitrogenase molybdenum-iron protein beta chain
MAVPLLRSRAGCALHGALLTASAIDGVTPLIHSTAGCGFQASQFGKSGGFGRAGNLAAASSNISEKHIVFGGSSRLREQIKNTAGMVRGELTVVLSGCATEMIGDDIAAMVKEAVDQGEPVLDIATAGFRGSAYLGYELFLKGVIDHFAAQDLEPAAGEPGLVNILGLVPSQDAFWLAEIEELSRMIAGIGLRPNPLFGPDGGVQGLRDLTKAELSLVVSPWGLAPARELQRRFGIPWLDAGGLPVGADASATLLRRVSAVAANDQAIAETFLTAEARRQAYILDAAADGLYRQQPQRDFAIVAPSLHATGLARFLIQTLGWSPRAIVVTDNPAPESRVATADGLGNIHYSEDSGEIDDILRGSDPEIVFGSAFERPVTAQLGIPLIETSFPISRPGWARGLAGFRGGLALIEEIVALPDAK